MLNRIKIGPKLIGGFLIVSLIGAGMGIYGIINLLAADAADTMLYESGTAPLGTVISITENFQRSRVNIRDAITQNDPAQIQTRLQQYDTCSRAVEDGIREYAQGCVTDACRQVAAELDRALKGYQGWAAGTRPLIEQNRDEEAWAKVFGEGRGHADALRDSIAKAVEQKIGFAREISETNSENAKATISSMTLLMILATGIAVGIGIFLTFSITKPLLAGVEMMQELSKGHLDRRLKLSREDEIGVLATTMDQFAEDLQKHVVSTMQRISQGDVSMDVPAKDSKDEIAPALNAMITAIRGLIAEAGGLVKAAVEGRLSTRGNAANFKGAWREIVDGVNQTLDAVVKPVNEAAQVLEQVAGRDLTSRVKGDYQGDHARIKTALNQAVDNLDSSLQQVAVAAAQVASASGQISSGSQSLAQGSSEQASTLEEIASSLQEVTSMAASNASFAQEAQTLAAQARESSSSGMHNMEQLSEAIQKIKASADETAKIVRTIDEIAFQTNLLALNAAVEAARAGEAGKGFAVVAEEVRNLAIRCAEAAKNTANLIEGSVKNSEDGVRINAQVLGDLREISQQVERVTQGMQEIATASEQQRQGINQVNTAVEQMSQLTQSSAANAEESASAAEELSGQAEEMNHLVAGFRLSRGDSQYSALAAPQSRGFKPNGRALPPARVNGKDKSGEARRPTQRLILDASEDNLAQF